jgi:hypothetical protein
MASASLSSVLLLLVLVQHCFTFPGGPPTIVCSDLRPLHPGAPSNGSGGFVIGTDIPIEGGGYSYTAGTTYEGQLNISAAWLWCS